MDRKNNISEIYRKQVDEVIDDQHGRNFIDTLRREELDYIWDEISAGIDIEEVWNNISSELDTISPELPGPRIILRSIAAVLIILFGLFPVIRKAETDEDIPLQEISSTIDRPDLLPDKALKETQGSPDSGEKEETIRYQTPGMTLTESGKRNKLILSELNIDTPARTNHFSFATKDISDLIISTDLVHPDISFTNDINEVKDPEIHNALPSVKTDNVQVLFETEKGTLKIKNNSSTGRSPLSLNETGRISGGVITSFKNTWLLNNETFEGLRSESLTTTKMMFFPDFGLNLNYSLSNTWQIQADGFLYSSTGQRYQLFESGHYIKKSLTLRYSTIALSAKRKFPGSISFAPGTSFNVQAGIYLSVLQQADLRKDTNLEKIGSQYQGFDLGLKLGGEIELPVTNYLSVAPGLFFSLGIPNIYKGYGDIPGYMRRTRNGNEGLHITFYYHLN